MLLHPSTPALRTAERFLREERDHLLRSYCVQDKSGKPIRSTMDGAEARHVKRVEFALRKVRDALRPKAPANV